jgi:hypothetical protein
MTGLQDAFAKLERHLKHNRHDGGCSSCEPDDAPISVDWDGEAEFGE